MVTGRAPTESLEEGEVTLKGAAQMNRIKKTAVLSSAALGIMAAAFVVGAATAQGDPSFPS
jgi:hypothetical protein